MRFRAFIVVYIFSWVIISHYKLHLFASFSPTFFALNLKSNYAIQSLAWQDGAARSLRLDVSRLANHAPVSQLYALIDVVTYE